MIRCNFIYKHKFLLGIGCCLSLLISGSTTNGQEVFEFLPANGNYNDGANWDNPFGLPDASLAEQSSIDNGGLAFISETPIPTAGLLIGRTAGNSGSVEIRSGGDLSVETGFSIDGVPVGGNTEVGIGGDGRLTILDGGSLQTETLGSGGDAASTLTLEDGASLTVSMSSDLNRNTTIGSNVTFSTSSLDLGNAHRLTVNVTGGNVTPIDVSGNAELDGGLNLNFTGGTPAITDTWDIVDSGGFTGGFDSLTTSGDAPPGLGLVLSIVDGGNNGKLARIGLESQLSLIVDRGTGNVKIANDAPGVNVDINGYLITSPSGAELLDVGSWDNLASQGEPFIESNPSSIHVGELSRAGSLTLAGETSVDLGNLYDFTPAEFGDPYPVVDFQYNLADNQVRIGNVIMTGPENNMVLVVDPDSGETFLQNQSAFDLDINGYLVTSDSDSLDTNSWVSLADAGQDFLESNPSAKHAGELSRASSLALNGNSDAVPLGNLFDADNPAAMRDLVFTYNLTGGAPQQGLVVYGRPVDAGVPRVCGDFDSDGDVDAADRTSQTVGWTGALAGGGTSSFADGDCDGDGDVDTADLTGLVGNWTGAMAGNLVDGGDADLVYDPTTGNVTLDAEDTAAGMLISFVVGTNENNLNNAATQLPFIDVGTNTDNTPFQIGQTDPLNQGAGPAIDLGNIFPLGLDLAGLEEYLSIAEYASELGAGGTLDLRVVPEPTSIWLGLIGLLGLVRRGRRSK